MGLSSDRSSDVILILTSVPDAAVGQAIADRLVGDGLAACVHIMAPHTATYRWKGKIETATEQDVLIKTTQSRYQAVEAAILALHPYELPALLALPVTGGSQAFLDWITRAGAD